MSARQSTAKYRPIKGFPGYRVGDDGSVWSLWTHGNGKIGETWHPRKFFFVDGRPMVMLRKKAGVHLHRTVCRLVLAAFVGPCPKGMESCHFPDRNPANNSLKNLRWDTRKNNHADKIIHGTHNRGERHPNVVLTTRKVKAIRLERSRGAKLLAIAKKYRICEAHVWRLTHGTAWAHLPR